MIRNYFLVAIRNLTRNKFFSTINIFGLAVSMTICMAIIMLVADQMKYDRHNTKRDRIFRINSFSVDNNGVDRSSIDNATSPMPLRDELLEKYTGIEKVVRIKRGFGNNWLGIENQNVNIPIKGFFADPEFFDLFEYEFEYGDPVTSLKEPYSVVLTREAADKLFEQANPLGQSLKVGDLGNFTVTGILKRSNNKSHIVFEAMASMATVASLEAQGKSGKDLNDWMNFWTGWNYILIKEGTSLQDINRHLDQIYKEHIASVSNPEAYKAKFRLQNLVAMTPGPLINNNIGPSLPWIFVYVLGGLAGVIMLTSCFNFTNLSIARSLKRSKEIGVRKVAGAARWQIFSQFIAESIVIALCALFFSGILLFLFKPVMLQLNFAKIFLWDLEANAVVFAVFLAFAILVGILAGFFPAVVLSAFEPVKVLKSLSTVKVFSRMGLRKALLVVQFTLSLVFILSVIVMYNQLDLFLNKDYGFNMKENIAVKLNETPASSLKNELLRQGNITSVAAASHIPAGGTTYGDGFKKDLSEKEWTALTYFVVDEDYLKNMELSLVAGTFYQPGNEATSKDKIVINEQTVKAFHFKSATDAIGEQIIYQRDSTRKTIIGVVKDYNHNALMSKIDNLALMFDPSQINLLQVRYNGSREEAVKSIEKAWASVNPGLKVDMKDVEEEIEFFYNTVFGDLVSVVGVIAALAIMISCLGLLGMATYTIETRMKEVSIRKVLGSSDKAVVMLLSKGFVTLLLIAVLIGTPVAWFLNNLWLELMAYRTEMDGSVIAIGVGILFLLGLITISTQTLRAAFANPVDNLKNE